MTRSRGRFRIAAPALLCVALLSTAGCDGAEAGAEAVPPTTQPAVATVTATPTPAPTSAPEPPPEPSPTPTTEAPPAETTPEVAAEGIVQVLGIIDGDTIDVDLDGERTRVRVIGLDAPERDECGYQEAASAMQSLAQSREVRLEADPTQLDVDVYGRLLRHVFTLEGLNVAEQIIEQGFAVEYTYDKPYAHVEDFLAAQARAQEAGLGIWGPLCATPLAAVGDAPATTAEAGEECVIKGNINRKGERIYHQPHQQHYDDTIIDTFEGERWFCTPEEAEEAGWRPAKR